MQVHQEKRVRKAPVRLQAPVEIVKKKTKKSPAKPKQKKGRVGGLGNKAPNAAQRKVNDFFRSGEGLSVGYPGRKKDKGE